MVNFKSFKSFKSLNFWKKDNGDNEDGYERNDTNFNNLDEQSNLDNNDQPKPYDPFAIDSSEENTVFHPVTDDSKETTADPEKAKKFNAVVQWIFSVGIFVLPLFFMIGTTGLLELNKQVLLIGFVGLATIIWLLGIVSSGYLFWVRNPIDKGILALLAAFIISTVFSVSSFKSIFGINTSLSNSLVSIIGFTILYFLIVNNSKEGSKMLKSLIGLSMLIALVSGCLQLFGINVFGLSISSQNSFNTVGSVNTLGIFAAISITFLSKLTFSYDWANKFYLQKVGVAVALLVLILLNSWFLWTVAIVGMIGVIVFESLAEERFKVSKFILPMVIIILGIFLLVIKLNVALVKDSLPIEVTPSFSLSRDILYSTLKENKYFGYGLENFSIAFDKHGAVGLRNTTLSGARFSDSASEFTTLLIQGGIVMMAGLLFLFWCVGFLFWKIYRSNSRGMSRDLVKPNTDVLAVAFAMVAALFLYPFNMTLMMLFYVFFALISATLFYGGKNEYNIEERPALSLLSSLSFIGGLILILVGVYFGSSIYISDLKYAQALKNENIEERASLLVEAINWNNHDDRYYRTASQTALSIINQELGVPRSPDRDAKISNLSSSAVSFARRATEIAPQESLNWANLGFVYENLLTVVDGVDKLAEDSYLKASEFRVGDPVFFHRIGTLYLAKHNLLVQLVNAKQLTLATAVLLGQEALNKAEENFKKAIDLSPNFGLAIYSLGGVYDRQGNLDEAIVQLEKLTPFNSNQPGLAFELGLLYYRNGNKEKSFNQLQKAVVIQPNYANALWYLALIYEERGEIDRAIEQLVKITSIKENRDNPVVKTKLNELNAGLVRIPPGNVLDQQPIQ